MKKKNSVKKGLVLLTVCAVCLSAIFTFAGCSGAGKSENPESSATSPGAMETTPGAADTTTSAAADEEVGDTFNESDYKEVSYEDLKTTYKGTKVKMSGVAYSNASQVTTNTNDEGEKTYSSDLYVSGIKPAESESVTELVAFHYNPDVADSFIQEDDMITVYGTYYGLKDETTLPFIYPVDKIVNYGKAEEEAETATASATETKTETNESAPSSGSGSGTIGDYAVKIKSSKLVKNYKGEACIQITLDFTNNSDEKKSYIYSLNAKAFQDGIELSDAFLLDEDNSTKEIKPGKTIKIKQTFVLDNKKSPVEIEVGPWLDWSGNGEKVTKTFPLKK